MVLAIWQTGRSSQTENVGHGVQPRPLGDQELRCGERSDSVTVARLAANVHVDRLAKQAEDDRMLAHVVPHADRVVADFVRRPLSRPPLPAMHVRGLSHFLGHDFPEGERGAARSVLFQPVMPFDDLDVDPLRVRTQRRAASRTSFIVKLTARLIFGARISGVSCDAAMTAAR